MSDYNRNSPLTGAVASAFIKSFEEELKSDSYAVVLSQSPVSEIAGEAFSPQRDYNSVNGLLLATLPEWSVARCAKRYQWKKNTKFESWKSTENMFGKRFYCDYRIDEGINAGAWAVQLCVHAPDNGTASINPPDKISATPFETPDGYRWITLFTITGRLRQFVDNKVIPVPDQLDLEERYKKYRSSDPALIKRELEQISKKEGGKIIAVNITDYDTVRKLRWENKPSLTVTASPGNAGRDANIQPRFSYVADSNYPDNAGWQLDGFDILDGGSGYNTSDSYSLRFTAEPKQTQFNVVKVTTLDHIFGGDRLTFPDGKTQQDSLIKMSITGPIGFADAQAILYADILRLNMLITADQVKETLPDDATISSVSLVKDPYIYGKKASVTKSGYETGEGSNVKVFKAYDVVKVSSSSAIANNSKVSATEDSGTGKRGSGQIVSSKTTGSVTEYTVINSKNFSAGSEIYNTTKGGSNTVTPSTQVTLTFSTKTGSGATTQTITSVEESPVSFGEETKVLGVFDFNDTALERAREGILIRLSLTNDGYIK